MKPFLELLPLLEDEIFVNSMSEEQRWRVYESGKKHYKENFNIDYEINIQNLAKKLNL